MSLEAQGHAGWYHHYNCAVCAWGRTLTRSSLYPRAISMRSVNAQRLCRNWKFQLSRSRMRIREEAECESAKRTSQSIGKDCRLPCVTEKEEERLAHLGNPCLTERSTTAARASLQCLLPQRKRAASGSSGLSFFPNLRLICGLEACSWSAGE